MDSKVIGYFAYLSPTQVVCDGDACVISGSKETMRNIININFISSGVLEQPTIKKTSFGEIIAGMKIGSAYAFDEESYNRFYPLANRVGFDLKEEDFTVPTGTRHRCLMVVRLRDGDVSRNPRKFRRETT